MKLRGWHVAGFGSLVDWRQDELSRGLNVFYGPNEAGKSTLLAFLRFALFGFRPGNTKDLKYPPPPGIQHGGTVLLEDRSEESHETYVVERIVNPGRSGKRLRIERPNGDEAPESELVRLLGHADRDLFNNVFAFSLTELQSLESLTEKGVQDHIFSAGITGAGRSARDALEQIRKEADELFKGRARTRVSVLVDEIAQVDELLRAGRERARAYPELAERERELADRCVALRDDLEARRRAGQRARKLCELWSEVYGPMLDNKAQLEGLVANKAFGAQPRMALDTCIASLDRAIENAAESRREIGKLSSRLDELASDTPALAVREDVEKLERDLGLYESQCKEVSKSEQDVAAQENALRDALANLGPDWDEARLRETHVSVPVATEATRFEVRLKEARDRVSEFERQGRDGEARLEGLRESRMREVAERNVKGVDGAATSERSPLTLPPTKDELDCRAAVLRELRASVARRSTLEVRIEGAHALIEASRHAGGGSAGSNPYRRLLAAIAGIGCVALLVMLAQHGLQFSSQPLFVVALAALVFGAIGWLALGRPGSGAQLGLPDLDSLEAELNALKREIGSAAAQLEIAPAPNIEDIESAATGLDRDFRLAMEREQWQANIDRLDADMAHVQTTIDSHAESTSTATRALESLREEWVRWGASVGLPAALEPRDVALFAGEVKTARRQIVERDKARLDRDTLFSRIDDWERRARAVLDKAGETESVREREVRGAPELISAFSKLTRRVRQADERERQRPEVEAALVEVRKRAAGIESTETTARKQLADLLARVGATDREDYLSKLAEFERRTQLETRVNEQFAELARRIGLGEDAERLRAELETGRVGEWESQVSAAEVEAETLQEESDEIVRTHRDVETQIEQLHGSNSVAALELSRSTLQQEMAECIARWRELQVARALIERTLERFERERQPAVLTEASHHFATVTGGRYPNIVQTAEVGGFSVVDTRGERKTPDELSRGTAEQLYVCIRLGLIAEFSRRAAQLPVAMDDVLVNFDDDRALAMAKVLADFSKRNDCQVLVFTCSSRTRDLFRGAAPDALHLEFATPGNVPAPRSPSLV